MFDGNYISPDSVGCNTHPYFHFKHCLSEDMDEESLPIDLFWVQLFVHILKI